MICYDTFSLKYIPVIRHIKLLECCLYNNESLRSMVYDIPITVIFNWWLETPLLEKIQVKHARYTICISCTICNNL